jgi:manganese/zinc/iron transport system permease protein
MSDALLIILTGAFVGGACALVGSFLVLRKLSMLGDAISHAVLPGIALAFLMTASRASVPMFVGAVLFGVLTAFLVQYLTERGIQGDAAIGVTFTSLFALGVVLVSLYGSHVDLDLECVLYGEIAYTPFDRFVWHGTDLGPRALWINVSLFAVDLGAVLLLYKQLQICAFDPELADSVGIPVKGMHYVLMGLVAITTVGAFESVGAILVVAMLIVPGATAYLLTDRLGRLLAIAVGLGASCAVFGYALAARVDGSIAGAMATVAGAFFAVAFLFSPKHGVVSRVWARGQLRRRVAEEDVLLWAGRRAELAGGAGGTFAAIDVPRDARGTPEPARPVLKRLRRGGMVELSEGLLQLTEAGLARAQELLRRHRVYESYLGELGYDPSHVHDPADRVEHYIRRDIVQEVEAAAHFPQRDPHDRPIPDPRREATGSAPDHGAAGSPPGDDPEEEQS